MNVELPYLWYIVVLLSQNGFLSDFEGFWGDAKAGAGGEESLLADYPLPTIN